MGKIRFIRDNKVMNQKDYESFGEMVSQSDCAITEELLTKKEALKRYGNRH